MATTVALLAMGPAASTASANPCDRWGNTNPEQLTRKEARRTIRCLVNAARENAGLRGLDKDRRLQKAAQRHNNEMLGTGCFGHECPGEGALPIRLELVDYLTGGLSRWIYGENVAWGIRDRGTPNSIVAAWLASPSHRANILNTSFRDIGVGFSVGSPNTANAAGGIYTTDFGLRVG
jgi:uncharacterized protein YkwD